MWNPFKIKTDTELITAIDDMALQLRKTHKDHLIWQNLIAIGMVDWIVKAYEDGYSIEEIIKSAKDYKETLQGTIAVLQVEKEIIK